MADRTIYRGDSYALRRPLWIHTLLNEAGTAFDLRGSTVRTTYRTTPASVDNDPTDAQAVITHNIVIDAAGVVTSQNGLFLQGAATAGILQERLTAAQTRALPLASLVSDIEVTDANAEKFSIVYPDKLITADAHTHRTT